MKYDLIKEDFFNEITRIEYFEDYKTELINCLRLIGKSVKSILRP